MATWSAFQFLGESDTNETAIANAAHFCLKKNMQQFGKQHSSLKHICIGLHLHPDTYCHKPSSLEVIYCQCVDLEDMLIFRPVLIFLETSRLLYRPFSSPERMPAKLTTNWKKAGIDTA